MAPHLPGLHQSLGGVFPDGAVGDPAQGQQAVVQRRRGVAVQVRGGEQVHVAEVGQPGYAYVDQLLSGAVDLQGAADPAGGVVDQSEPVLSPVLAGDVDGGQGDRRQLALAVPHRGDTGQPGVLARLAAAAEPGTDVPGPAACHRLAQFLL